MRMSAIGCRPPGKQPTDGWMNLAGTHPSRGRAVLLSAARCWLRSSLPLSPPPPRLLPRDSSLYRCFFFFSPLVSPPSRTETWQALTQMDPTALKAILLPHSPTADASAAVPPPRGGNTTPTDRTGGGT